MRMCCSTRHSPWTGVALFLKKYIEKVNFALILDKQVCIVISNNDSLFLDS